MTKKMYRGDRRNAAKVAWHNAKPHEFSWREFWQAHFVTDMPKRRRKGKKK